VSFSGRRIFGPISVASLVRVAATTGAANAVAKDVQKRAGVPGGIGFSPARKYTN